MMPLQRKYTCINCPAGCTVVVTCAQNGRVIVDGYECAQGNEYGKEEFLSPRRILTGTVLTQGAVLPVLPVKTTAGVSKGDISSLYQALASFRVHAPVTCGQILLENFGGRGIHLVATRNLLRAADEGKRRK